MEQESAINQNNFKFDLELKLETKVDVEIGSDFCSSIVDAATNALSENLEFYYRNLLSNIYNKESGNNGTASKQHTENSDALDSLFEDYDDTNQAYNFELFVTLSMFILFAEFISVKFFYSGFMTWWAYTLTALICILLFWQKQKAKTSSRIHNTNYTRDPNLKSNTSQPIPYVSFNFEIKKIKEGLLKLNTLLLVLSVEY